MKKGICFFLVATFVPSYTTQEGRVNILGNLVKQAVTNDNVDQLKRLFEKYPYLTTKINSSIILSNAASEKADQIVAYLLTEPKIEVNVNVRGPEGATPLIIAAQQGNVRIVQLLLNHHADISLIDTDGNTALMFAAQAGHLDIVRMLLEKNSTLPEEKNILNMRNNEGQTALWMAIDGRREKIVRLLLQYGADPNSADLTRNSPLHLAVSHSDTDVSHPSTETQKSIIQALLDAGADINAVEQEAEATPLLYATDNGYLEAAKLLVEKGADINQVDIHGYTPLSSASINGYANIVTFLLGQEGINTEIEDENHKPAILHAASSPNVDVIRAFLRKGYSVNSTNTEKDTLLHTAVSAKQHNTAQFLLAQGASVDSINEKGQTPLMFAAMEGDTKMVTTLLDHGADPTITDTQGKTASSYAAQAKRFDIVRLLKKRRARKRARPSRAIAAASRVVRCPIPPTAPTARAEIPTTRQLQQAITNGETNIVTRLLGESFDASWQDEEGETFLMNAVKRSVLDPATRRDTVLDILLSNPTIVATIDTQNNKGETALHLGLDNPKIIEKLLHHNAKPDITDTHGDTIVIRATRKDGANLGKLLDLLKKQMKDTYPDLLNQQDHEGMSAVMYAIKKNDPTNVKRLLSDGAGTTIVSNEGLTPLELAHQILALIKSAEEPDKEQAARAEQIVDLLTKATQPEAQPATPPESPQKPVMTGEDPLWEELTKGDRAKVHTIERILRSRPRDLSRQRAGGTTPLMIAIESKVPETVVRYILDKVSQEQVNLKQTITPFASALTKAINGARESFVKLLLEKGASFTADDIGLAKVLVTQAQGPNQRRLKKRLKKIVRLLEKAQERQQQERILLLAAHGGDQNIVDSALDTGASIDTQDEDGNTPLMRAILANKDATARHLIEKGARPNIRNKQGKTALMLAAQQNNYALVDYLLAHHADTKILDNTGNTASSSALARGHLNVANRIRIYQALQHLQKTQTIPHVLERHHDPKGRKTTVIIGPEGQDTINKPYTGRLDDGTTASFFPQSWNPGDIQKGIETMLPQPEQLDERPATINADGEEVKEALILRGTYNAILMKVIVSKGRQGDWIVFTAYPNITRG